MGVSEIRERDTAMSVMVWADISIYLAKDSGRSDAISVKDIELVKTGT